MASSNENSHYPDENFAPLNGAFRRTRAASLASLALIVVFGGITPVFAQSICNAGNQIITTRVDLTASCTITGSLSIHGGMVAADFTAAPGAVLRVEGDVTVTGAGILRVDGGTFEIQQNFNRHRQLLTTDDATVILKDTTVVVNQGDGLKYLVHYATGRSKTFVVGSDLDRTRNWLITDCREQSTLVGIASLHLPTEIYVKDNSTVSLAEPGTHTGVWMDFEDGAVGTINLPVQSANGELLPYSWRVGRGLTGLTGVGWRLEIANATVGLGMESHSGSRITINGRGAPSSGEIKIAYHTEVGVQTLSSLGIGLQNRIMGGNQLTLRNVELGPIAWQIYAHTNTMLTITSSIVNEIGVSNGGHITVRDSIIQFGGVTSLGHLGASIEVHNSQIHGQTIEALRDGIVDIHDSAVFGAVVVSHLPTSTVNFYGGAFLKNSADACPLVLTQMMNAQGIPNCNPFLSPGAAVTRAGEGVVTCAGTDNCSW
jgi:hypothetical protein